MKIILNIETLCNESSLPVSMNQWNSAIGKVEIIAIDANTLGIITKTVIEIDEKAWSTCERMTTKDKTQKHGKERKHPSEYKGYKYHYKSSYREALKSITSLFKRLMGKTDYYTIYPTNDVSFRCLVNLFEYIAQKDGHKGTYVPWNKYDVADTEDSLELINNLRTLTKTMTKLFQPS